jgi:predicted TIM-barrel fold metal-dependent hydrolase
LNRKISDYYKSNIYVTPSGLFSEAQLQFVISEVGADRIIYSGDYPFLIDKNTKGFLETASISKEDKEKIAYRNAEKLLKLKV